MNFENELKQVFDIDIWQLKPQFYQEKHRNLDIKDVESLENIDDTMIVETLTADNSLAYHDLVYSNKISSDKVINFIIQKSISLTFLKNIIEKLFYKSKVCIYYASSTNDKVANENGALVINQEDFIQQDYKLFSVESKKYILEKLYQYADFKTH